MEIVILLTLLVIVGLTILLTNLWRLVISKDSLVKQQAKQSLIIGLLIAMVGFGSCVAMFGNTHVP